MTVHEVVKEVMTANGISSDKVVAHTCKHALTHKHTLIAIMEVGKLYVYQSFTALLSDDSHSINVSADNWSWIGRRGSNGKRSHGVECAHDE